MDAGYLFALNARAVSVIQSGKLACLRCGGSGVYHTYGRCFRCNGAGIDPSQPAKPEKSKRVIQQRKWAATFNATTGRPLPRVCPFCDHVIDHCVVRVCAAHQAERGVDEFGVKR